MLKLFDWERTLLFGGSVSVWIFKLMVHLQASSIALIGQDLATSAGTYYVGDGFSPLGTAPEDFYPNPHAHGKRWNLPGYHGGVVFTQADYFLFHDEFVRSVKEIKARREKIALYNCTEGGAFIDGFFHKPLSYFLMKFATVPLENNEEKTVMAIKKDLSKTDLMITYLETVIKRCVKVLLLIKEGEEIFSGNKKISLLEKNSADIQELILKSEELSSMARVYMFEIERRLVRNEVMKNDNQINRELYQFMKDDCDKLVEACGEAIVTLQSQSDKPLVK